MQSNQDIPAPQPSGPAPAPATPLPQPVTTTPGTPLQPLIQLNGGDAFGRPHGLGGNDVIIGIGISLVLAAIFWFVGKVLTDTLVKQFAEVGSAKRAGMMLFLFLAVVATFATFGFLGNYWLALYFLIPGATLAVLLFFMLIFSLVAANRSKRK
jgi:hypothetical protein